MASCSSPCTTIRPSQALFYPVLLSKIQAPSLLKFGVLLNGWGIEALQIDLGFILDPDSSEVEAQAFASIRRR